MMRIRHILEVLKEHGQVRRGVAEGDTHEDALALFPAHGRSLDVVEVVDADGIPREAIGHQESSQADGGDEERAEGREDDEEEDGDYEGEEDDAEEELAAVAEGCLGARLEPGTVRCAGRGGRRLYRCGDIEKVEEEGFA